MRPERVCTIIALDHNEPEDEFDDEDNDDLDVANDYQGANRGNAVRNHITNTHF